ncbi:glycosyltransferase family 2 protein [Candidatus Woesearchaeota archaeon]|nr:glycosyltransferase family 2 protein [Candidatus Woesearchaeota archaeon]
MADKIWAVIPAYNEEKSIGKIVSETKKYVDRVVVVDDGSKDETGKIAKKNNAIVLSHVVNIGKGAALKTGCDFATESKAGIIIVLDADAQHEPKEIPKFLESARNKDIVFGYRKPNKDMPLVLKFGNWFISKTIKLLYGVDIKDSQCGYRAFTKDAYKKIRWKALDYSMESEMIAKAGRHNLRYGEVPIQTIYSDKYKGTTIIDGVKIVMNMLLWRFIKNG